jgi:hypothetical protein
MGVEEDTAAVEDKKEYGHARGLHLQLSNETERAALLADDYKKQNEPKKKKEEEESGWGLEKQGEIIAEINTLCRFLFF